MKKFNKKLYAKFKQNYYAYYDDIKDHSKGVKEDW